MLIFLVSYLSDLNSYCSVPCSRLPQPCCAPCSNTPEPWHLLSFYRKCCSPDVSMAHSFTSFRSLSQMSLSHAAVPGYLSKIGKPSHLSLGLLYVVFMYYVLYHPIDYLKHFIFYWFIYLFWSLCFTRMPFAWGQGYLSVLFIVISQLPREEPGA